MRRTRRGAKKLTSPPASGGEGQAEHTAPRKPAKGAARALDLVVADRSRYGRRRSVYGWSA